MNHRRHQIQEGASLLSLKANLETIGSTDPPLASCCIYKVPPRIRRLNEESYTPTFVSIGPFHHGKKRLESNQQLKLWYLHKFLKRNQEKSLDDYLKFLQDMEDRIRRCYSETIKMDSNDFIIMILTDACFIIELFLDHQQPRGNDPLVSKPWPKYDILLDLVLIENQLPFFVLEGLFNQTGFIGVPSFLDRAIPILVSYFIENIYYAPPGKILYTSSFPRQAEHFCDILRAVLFSPTNPPPRSDLRPLTRSYSVSQLQEAGVKLQAEQGKKLTEVSFSEGVLRIPSIRVSKCADLLLRNVVAFEQCYYPSQHCLTDYLVLLDFLIQSGKDVEVLVEKGIMESFLDSDTVASLFTKLRMDLVETSVNESYASLHTDLYEFYNIPSNKYKAIFVRDYWSTPWKKASSVAAVVLLFLTFIQTICSIVPLFK